MWIFYGFWSLHCVECNNYSNLTDLFVIFLLFQILAPRLGYLPLLVRQIKPFFSNSLPPGVDTVWFEYKGLPLKWYFYCSLTWIMLWCTHLTSKTLLDIVCTPNWMIWNATFTIWSTSLAKFCFQLWEWNLYMLYFFREWNELYLMNEKI